MTTGLLTQGLIINDVEHYFFFFFVFFIQLSRVIIQNSKSRYYSQRFNTIIAIDGSPFALIKRIMLRMLRKKIFSFD